MINKPETITRTHDLTYQLVTAVVKNPGITSLWRVRESYKGKDLFHWYLDQANVRYTACWENCGWYGARPKEPKWKCQVCTEKVDYQKRFEIRIAEACGAARKVLKDAHVRKARKGNRIVFTYYPHVEKDLDAVLNKFNLKLGFSRRCFSRRLDNPKAEYRRRQAEVEEYNPLRRLEMVLNGEEQ